jgi:hypothetical protein
MKGGNDYSNHRRPTALHHVHFEVDKAKGASK